MTTSTSPAAVLFQTLLSQLSTDILTSSEGLLGSFFDNIASNPTPQNVVAQALLITAAAPLQLPSLEKEGIAQIAATGKALLALAPTTVPVTL